MSTAQQKSKRQKFAAVLNGLIFNLGGALYIEDGKLFFASIHFLAGFANSLSMGPWKQRYSKSVANFIQVFNIIIAVMSAWDHFRAEKKYIPYIWILVALFALAMLWWQNRKSIHLSD